MIKVREHFLLDEIPPPPALHNSIEFKSTYHTNNDSCGPVGLRLAAPSNGQLVVNWINFESIYPLPTDLN